MRLSSVVLPDPFGPKMPTMSPSSSANDMSDTAVSPPNRFVRLRTSSSTALSRKEADDAARHQKDREDQDQPVDQQPRLRIHVDHVRKRRQHERADDGRGDELAAAEERHRDDGERLVERKVVRIDVADVERIETAGDRRADVAGDERDELVAEHVDAERVGELVVQADRREAASHPRVDDARVPENGERHGDEAQVIPHERTGHWNDATTGNPERRRQREVDAERAVGETVPVEDDEPDQFRERERHDREVELAQVEAEADRPDDDRDQRDEQHADDHAEPERNAEMDHRQVRRVGGQAECSRMEQRQLTGEAEDQVEADGEDAGDEREDEDRQDHVVVDDEWYSEQRDPQQMLHRFAKSPAGLNSKMSTSSTRP